MYLNENLSVEKCNETLKKSESLREEEERIQCIKRQVRLIIF